MLQLGTHEANAGFLKMSNLRIPRRHMMEKRQHVAPDGTYVKGPPPQEAAISSATAADDDDGAARSRALARPKDSKAHYITYVAFLLLTPSCAKQSV